MPPIAGNNANAKGAECHAVVFEDSRPALLGLGRSKSSVDVRKAFLASERDSSEKLDDRRLGMFPATFAADDLRVRRFDSSIVKALRMRAPPLSGCVSSTIFIVCHVVVVWRCLACSARMWE